MNVLIVLVFVCFRITIYSANDEPSSSSTSEDCIMRMSLSDYNEQRLKFIQEEFNVSFGNDIKLNENETKANHIIMHEKMIEYDFGMQNAEQFNPNHYIADVLDTIDKSNLYQIIRKMPKGGLLHAHAAQMGTIDFIISLTYWPHLWQHNAINNNSEIVSFKFSSEQPTNQNRSKVDTEWRLVKDVRTEIGSQQYDEHLRSLLTITVKQKNMHREIYTDDEMWKRFFRSMSLIYPIISYAPAVRATFEHILNELLLDGVQYLELRIGLWPLYNLNGSIENDDAVFEIYLDSINEFKIQHPNFIDVKAIYAPSKRVRDKQIITKSCQRIQQLRKKFPSFVIGYDLTSPDSLHNNLNKYAESLLQIPNDVQLFFHAGETKWFGSIDESLIDAILLGSKRIGHAFSALKHPNVMEAIKQNNIAIEVNPISNQVLGYIDDFRNHPASVFMAQNIPIVISSDDPLLWGVKPLSHDFYVAFLGIASRYADLRVLKKLAINSIEYSALNATEKVVAFTKWQIQWDHFIEDLVEGYQ